MSFIERSLIGHCEPGLAGVAIHLKFQLDCFVAPLLAMTIKEAS